MPTSSTPGYTSFRGRVACTCLAAWLPVFEAELIRRGVVTSSIDIAQLTGNASASGGTHSEGGAFDIWQHDPTTVWVARQMGAATWARTQAQGFSPHSHGVLVGCPHNGPARYQIDALRRGENGLASRGADDGPCPLPARDWRGGIEWAKQQEEEMKPEDFAQIRSIVREELALADRKPARRAEGVRARLARIAKRLKES